MKGTLSSGAKGQQEHHRPLLMRGRRVWMLTRRSAEAQSCSAPAPSLSERRFYSLLPVLAQAELPKERKTL